MSENVIEVTDAQFQSEILDSNIPVIVDFFATWCGPCRMFAPIFHEVADQYVGKVKFVKANVDDNQMASAEHGVRSIPTIKLFKNGQVVATSIGSMGLQQLINFIATNA